MSAPPRADVPLLEAAAVDRVYGARSRPVVALRGVSLQLRRGARVGVVGESGSGKSTLCRLLVALELPDRGEVRFRGSSLAGCPASQLRDLRRSVQMTFQDPVGSLDPRLRVGESVREPLRALRIPGDHRQRVGELLAAVGLPQATAGLYPHQLSGGQRQRVAIARALAPGPEALIADEAVSALDVAVRAQVLNLLAHLVAELGLALLLVSHDLAVVRHLCTRIVVLYRGEVVEEGPTQGLFERPQHPYTAALIAAIPRLGGRIGEA